MEVLVFSTSVQSQDQVERLAPKINSLVGSGLWNFALDDSDKILRIVSDNLSVWQTISLLREHGFDCKELD